MSISEAEWRSALEKALGRSSDKGATARELGQSMGVSNKTTLNRLRILMDAGRLEVGWRQTSTMSGIPGRVPVYWLVSSKKGRKK